MNSFPPENQDNRAENELPQEPRLATRRNAFDDTDEHERPSSPRPALRRAQTTPVRESSAPRTDRSSARRLWLHRAALSAAALACLGAIGLMGLTLELRHQVHLSQPQLDGTLHVTGLQQPVSVTRDAQGVPSLQAASLQDLLFAQGYVAAQDRLWQMDLLRRHASGELAAILGRSMVDHDKQQRILSLRQAADNALAAMPADQRAQLDAYAHGVNAFLDTHKGSLPVEFSLLHYTPEPWQPRDSMLVLLVLWQDLTTSFPTKLNREALSAHLPAELLEDIYPVGSFRDRVAAQPRAELSSPVESIDQIPLDSTQSLLSLPQDLLHRAQAVTGESCDDCRAGSNNWAVSGAHTATGRPLLSNDMHLALSLPDIWYTAALHTQGLNVEGFTLPGLPFVLAGRNEHVAWSETNLGADVQDVYVEHLRGSGSSTQYQKPDGNWAPVTHRQETIRVRGGFNVTFDVQSTEHSLGTQPLSTPLITPLYPREKRSLSLAWTAYSPAALSTPLLALNQASNGTELVAAASHIGGPSLNIVYADDQGHIGYHAIGVIPVRGSQERRPRNLPALDLGQPAPPEQEVTPVPEDEPETELRTPFAPPQLILAAWSPQRHHRGHALPPQLHEPRHIPRQAEKLRPEPEPAAPAPVVIDYTIGTAIANTPVDALNSAEQWNGTIPYDQLPSIVDPANGILATANSRITPENYPYAISDNWADPYRVERIYQVLHGRDKLSAADMLSLEMDAHSEFDQFLAQRLAYAIDHAQVTRQHPELRTAADLLRRFDGKMTTGSAAASIVSAVQQPLMQDLIAAKICQRDHLKPGSKNAQQIAALYHWGEHNTALELLLLHQPARWLPQGYSNWNEFLAGETYAALRQAHAPRDLAHWSYGSQHRQVIAHPVFGTHIRFFSWLLGTQASLKPYPVDGDATTVHATGKSFGPSERFTADLSSPDATLANITTGESGQPGSTHYTDQLKAYVQGQSFALPLQHSTAVHTLTLEP